MKCRNCGDAVDAERAELGYDYCLEEECQRACLKPVRLAALGVNKAAEYYTRAEEVLPPAPAARAWIEEEPAEPAAPPRAVREADKPGSEPRRVETPMDRLRRLDGELDQALHALHGRFVRGEITARELDRECDRLVEAFNDRVRQENIRYRSMLRPRSNRARIAGGRGRGL